MKEFGAWSLRGLFGPSRIFHSQQKDTETFFFFNYKVRNPRTLDNFKNLILLEVTNGWHTLSQLPKPSYSLQRKLKMGGEWEQQAEAV